MLDVLDADAVRRWCAETLAALADHRAEIDDLNVFPVPDGDTGTNLVLTLRGAVAALECRGEFAAADAPADQRPSADCHESAAAALDLAARGAVLAAKGNSGVILSQLLRGIADAVRPAPVVTATGFACALAAGTDAAYAAVAEPTEGTMLSVARAASIAAGQAQPGALADVVDAAADAAARALERTPQQLPVLARAGVVDAGGRGLALLLYSLVGIVAGGAAPDVPLPPVSRDPRALVAARESGSAEYAYEVQYLLEADQACVDRLRRQLGALGDSLVVVGTGERLWNVHVHVNDAGAAVEAGVAAGRPYRVTVTRFADEPAPAHRPGRGAVAVCAGDGLAALFRAEGALVVESRPPAEPTAEGLLAAIRETAAGDVVVLPNGCRTALVEEVAEIARQEGRTVAVVPTRSAVQGLAALSVRDPVRRFADDVIIMAEAAGATRWGEVIVAARDALTTVGTCHAGDVVGLAEGDVVVLGRQIAEVATALLDRLLGAGGELATIVLGAGAGALRTPLAEHVRGRWPMVEAVVYDGGQPDCPVLFGVE